MSLRAAPLLVPLMALAAAACVGLNSDQPPPVASPPRGGDDAVDAGASDAPATDAAGADATNLDATSFDGSNVDAAPVDASAPDAASACGADACIPRAATRLDFDGDGRADFAVVAADGIYVAISTGSAFDAPRSWSAWQAVEDAGVLAVPTAGNVFFGDVTGDGRADAILVDGASVWVMSSDGARFGVPVNGNHYAAPNPAPDGAALRAIGFADVTGDGVADAIFATVDRIYVMVSKAGTFGFAQNWTDGVFYGTPDTFFADIDGDGKDDAIASVAVWDGKVYAMRSTGAAFDGYNNWTDTALGGLGRFADVTGDGKADALSIMQDGMLVKASSGTSFEGAGRWFTPGAFAAVIAADVNGDGKADLVLPSAGGIDVMLSAGSSFGGPVRWWTGAVPSFPSDAGGAGD